MKKLFSLAAVCLTVACLTVVAMASMVARAADKTPSPTDEPSLTVQQARREVQMLNDVYLTAVVLINDTFVNDGNGVSAGDAAREMFAAIRKKGWHDARLIDATGKPMNDANIPAKGFETTAIAKILEGETYYDEVVEEGGKKYLRAATVVPVVNNKCVSCHPGNKVGGVLGAVSYKLPIR